MSRPVWHLTFRAELQNSTSGVVEIHARDLITLRELRAQIDRALRMCETLSQPEPEAVPIRNNGLRAVHE
jgi:hypothetical protein